MPKVRRESVPPELFQHLLNRVHDRNVKWQDLEELASWLDGDPAVPAGPWIKRFRKLVVCGEAELVKTFLRPGRPTRGKEL